MKMIADDPMQRRRATTVWRVTAKDPTARDWDVLRRCDDPHRCSPDSRHVLGGSPECHGARSARLPARDELPTISCRRSLHVDGTSQVPVRFARPVEPESSPAGPGRAGPGRGRLEQEADQGAAGRFVGARSGEQGHNEELLGVRPHRSRRHGWTPLTHRSPATAPSRAPRSRSISTVRPAALNFVVRDYLQKSIAAFNERADAQPRHLGRSGLQASRGDGPTPS